MQQTSSHHEYRIQSGNEIGKKKKKKVRKTTLTFYHEVEEDCDSQS